MKEISKAIMGMQPLSQYWIWEFLVSDFSFSSFQIFLWIFNYKFLTNTIGMIRLKPDMITYEMVTLQVTDKVTKKNNPNRGFCSHVCYSICCAVWQGAVLVLAMTPDQQVRPSVNQVVVHLESDAIGGNGRKILNEQFQLSD